MPTGIRKRARISLILSPNVALETVPDAAGSRKETSSDTSLEEQTDPVAMQPPEVLYEPLLSSRQQPVGWPPSPPIWGGLLFPPALASPRTGPS